MTADSELDLPPAPYVLLVEPPGALPLVTRRLRRRRALRVGAVAGVVSSAVLLGSLGVVQLRAEREPQEVAVSARDVRVSERVVVADVPDSWVVTPIPTPSGPTGSRWERTRFLTAEGTSLIVNVLTGSDFSGYSPGDPAPQPGSRPGTARGHFAWVLETGFSIRDRSTVKRSVQWQEERQLAFAIDATSDSGASYTQLAAATQEVIDRIEVI